MKIKSVKNVDNGTEVVVLLDKNETLDVNMCRRAGKQAEYDAYVIIDMLDDGVIVERADGVFRKYSVAPTKVASMIHDNIIHGSGISWNGLSKYFYHSLDTAEKSADDVRGRMVRIKGFNTETGQLFDLEEN